MAKKKKETDATKWKKKKWYSIVAPQVFNNQFLGETTTIEPGKVVGKSIKVNLMSLTGEVRNQNVNIRMRISGIKDGQAATEVTGYTLSPSFIKRVVRRKQSRLDDLCAVKTKDSKNLILKPMIITRNKANRSEIAALRVAAMQELRKSAAESNYDDFIKLLVHYRLQLDMRKKLSKIFPLKTFEVKKLDLKNA